MKEEIKQTLKNAYVNIKDGYIEETIGKGDNAQYRQHSINSFIKEWEGRQYKLSVDFSDNNDSSIANLLNALNGKSVNITINSVDPDAEFPIYEKEDDDFLDLEEE